MKKLIVTILLVSALTCGCAGVNKKAELETQNLLLENKEGVNEGVNQEEVIENTNSQKAEEQKDNIENLHPIDKAERDCIAKVYSTYDISQCSYKAMDSWFKEIDKYLGLLKTITTEEDYANILKSQEDWRNYQKSEFVSISLIRNKQGTIYQTITIGKEVYIVKQRALDLKSLYEYLVE